MREESLEEKVAWIHRDAMRLSARDQVELKFALKTLIARSTEALDLVRVELKSGGKTKLEYGS